MSDGGASLAVENARVRVLQREGRDEAANLRWMTIVCSVTAIWAVVLVAMALQKNHRFVYDDTFITMRYARHLMDGVGPRWNLGGAPVEGFSSPLHLLLLAALGKLGMPLFTATRVLGFGSHAVLVGFLAWFMSKRLNVFAGVMTAVLVATSWPMLVWDLGGLDEVLFAAFVTAGALVTLQYVETGGRREIFAGALLLGIAVFVRPDGALFAGVLLLACLALSAKPMRARVADVAMAAAIVAAVNIPWEIFRLAYFHAVLPNTYYAKVVGIPLGWRVRSGLEYWRVCAGNPPYLALLAFVVAVAQLIRRRVARVDLGLWACIAAYSLYIVTSGGDHMMAVRFMIPIISLLAVVMVRGLYELGALNRAESAGVVSLLLFFASWRQTVPTVDNPELPDWATVYGKQVASYIDTHWPAGAWVGINSAGATAYFADRLNYIDMLGLNDREIARRNPMPMYPHSARLVGHMKGDGASVLARRPEFLILVNANGAVLREGNPVYLVTEYELLQSREFPELYRACEVSIPVSEADQEGPPRQPPTMPLVYYQRRDLQLPCTPAA